MAAGTAAAVPRHETAGIPRTHGVHPRGTRGAADGRFVSRSPPASCQLNVIRRAIQQACGITRALPR
jgi:hypothetical protein